MKVDGKPMRSIWVEDDGWAVGIIDQTLLPHRFVLLRLETLEQAAHAIRSMQTRGAPLIGAYAALLATRPTAINLKGALDEMVAAVRNRPRSERVAAAYARAAQICDEDV